MIEDIFEGIFKWKVGCEQATGVVNLSHSPEEKLNNSPTYENSDFFLRRIKIDLETKKQRHLCDCPNSSDH